MTREVDAIIGRVMGDVRRCGHLDLEASEMAIRSSVHRLGGSLLEKLLNADGGGYRGRRIECQAGHTAEFVDYRNKRLVTVLSPVEAERAYYYCETCREGWVPKDADLDIVGTSLSPGVRRMMGQVGGKEAFNEGRKDLEALAGIEVTTKAVERVSEAVGEQIEKQSQQEREQIMSGKVIPFVGKSEIPMLYVAIDGSGVPVVARETEGRKGKDETEQAKTREAKLGCVFTQTAVDEKGYAIRDEGSTSYVGAIETAEVFGCRIYTEAVRRGLQWAKRVSVLGDGAKWIWGIAGEHFPGATQIIDLYHAREHLADLAKLVYGTKSPKCREWFLARRDEMDKGDVENMVAAIKRLRPKDEAVRDIAEKEAEYFQGNAARMRYAEFRSQGLFVGSGVVEAGCKIVFGQRLKLSGMHWTVRGANAIIALRCCQLSGRWEQFWESRAIS
jgi:hypothetical protein